jgi:hypothetical protein
MDKDKLKSWLATEGRDREWLANQIGSVKGTVDQWFSRGFPEWACKSIERLMHPIEGGNDTTGFEVTFTAREFERIEEARKLLGIATRKLYYEEAIAEYTDQILAREAADKTTAAQNISHFPAPMPSSLVAEDPTAYGASSGKPARKPKAKTGTED